MFNWVLNTPLVPISQQDFDRIKVARGRLKGIVDYKPYCTRD